MAAPLYSRLQEYAEKNRISFAMPSHKGRTDFASLCKLDVTELQKTADLHAESSAVCEANRALAKLYKADRSFILTGGSTAAVHAMIASAVTAGETILITPECHISVINICAVMGIKLRVADNTAEIISCLNKFPEIRAVLVTSPNYYGVCADIRNIAGFCHAHGKPLLVDAAHGAHFIASAALPECPVKYADLVCHSAHKTLNALTGAAYLHCKSGIIDADRVRQMINVFESSSPSYVIAASADLAREELENGGWEDIISLCADFRKKVQEAGLSVLENDDITRLAISLGAFGISGFTAERLLSDEYGIDVEMADLEYIVLITSPKNTEEDFNTLYAALLDIIRLNAQEPCAKFALPKITHKGVIDPQRAMARSGVKTELIHSAGLISCATVTAYPPATPIIIAGEAITDAQINAITAITAAGAKITGIKDGLIDTVEQ